MKFKILSIVLFVVVVFTTYGQVAEFPEVIPVKEKIKWEPLVEVNSEYDEFSPSLSPDGTMMIFSSARPGGLGDTDIWYSTKEDDKWQKPINMTILNSQWHDHEPCFSYDGNTLLFSSDRDGGYGTGDLYISVKKKNGWSKPYNLGPTINTSDSEKMPSLSMDRKELYFTRIPVDYQQRRLVVEKRQIYLCQKTEKGWSLPYLLPAPVNQLKLESSARIQADGRTLLFCSGREGGSGGYDLWKATREKTGMNWEQVEPLNQVNTPYNEVYFGSNIDGTTLFLASNRNPRKNFDIYIANISESLNDPTITLHGIVTNKETKQPLSAKIIVELEENKKIEAFTIKSDPQTGKYSITLPQGDLYTISAEKEGFLFFNRELNLENLKENKKMEENIELEPLKKGNRIVFKTIYFKPDSKELLSKSIPSLNRLLKLMQDNAGLKIRIEGHVADVGDREKGQNLSQARADRIKEFLVQNDINTNRVETTGLGATKPVGDNSTEAGRKMNRRTEMVIIENKR